MLALFQKWCKETSRSGGVLVGSSLREFFRWLDTNKYEVTKVQPKKKHVIITKTTRAIKTW